MEEERDLIKDIEKNGISNTDGNWCSFFSLKRLIKLEKRIKKLEDKTAQ